MEENMSQSIEPSAGQTVEPMFLSQEQVLNMKDKVVDATLAFNNTYVIIVSYEKEKKEVQELQHLSFSGKKLWHHQISKDIQYLSMLTEREVVIQNPAKNTIDIYDLSAKDIRPIQHDFLPPKQLIDIWTFSKSSFFCVVEFSYKGFRITYIDSNNTQKPVMFQHEQHLNQMFSPVKINSHSKLYWNQIVQSRTIQTNQISRDKYFYFVDLSDNKEKQLRNLKYTDIVYDCSAAKSQQSSIQIMGEISQGEYLVYLLSGGQTQPKDLYILDLRGETPKIKDNFLFFKGSPLSQFEPHSLLCKLSGQYLIMPAYVQATDQYGFAHLDQNYHHRTFYLNLALREIVAIQPTYMNTALTSTFSHRVLQYLQVEDQLYLKVVDTSLPRKDVSLHLLLTLNEDFDDDLLQDAVDLLH